MDKQREAFEHWYAIKYSRGIKNCFARSEAIPEEYLMPHTQSRFEAWQAAQQAQWLPIETAPRDGASVIAYRKGKHGIHIEAMYFADGAWYWSFDGDSPDQQPTHWMPLPPEPKP